MVAYTVPGMKSGNAEKVNKLLQDRLNSLNDLALTLKHVHWNVVGPNFIAVHTMLDPQVDAVRGMADETAERIAALGGSPVGTPGALVAQRDWDDYSIGRADALAHLGALDIVYAGIIEAHRAADRQHRGTRPGHPGHADRAGPPARAVPLVRPRPPGVGGRHAQHRRGGDGEHGRQARRAQDDQGGEVADRRARPDR